MNRGEREATDAGGDGGRGRGSLVLLAGLAPPMALGAALRLWGLAGQVLIGDEYHLVNWAVQPDWRQVFAYHPADPCMPLTAFAHLLIVCGVPLTELLCRLPAVIAGLAALVALPLLARRAIGWPGAVALAWLVAISPSLVYYSRIARPYILLVLLGTAAAAAFWRWWRRGGAGAATAYVLCAGAVVWFHPGTLPFVTAPLAFGAVELIRRRLRRAPGIGRQAVRLAGVALLLALAVAASVVPTWASLTQVAGLKARRATPSWSELGQVLELQAGSLAIPVVVLFWSLAAIGLVFLWRRRPEAALFVTLLAAAQWSAMALVLQPQGIDHSVVLNRYVLVTLPLVLLWVAEGLRALGGLAGRAGRWAPRGATAVLLAALAATSPYLAEPRLRLGPFAGSLLSIAFYVPPCTWIRTTSRRSTRLSSASRAPVR